MQLELAVAYNSRIETDIPGFTHWKSLYLEAPDKFNVCDNDNFYVLRVSLTDSVRPINTCISLFSFLLCKLFSFLTMSSLKCYKL